MHTIKIEETDNGLTRITLDRPKKRNAINQQMITELGSSLDSIENSVILLTGADGTFCSGDDTDELVSVDKSLHSHSESFIDLLALVRNQESVTIACIQGHAIGGGMFLAAACDFRLALKDAVFRVPAIDLGIPPAGGGTFFLIDQVGLTRAKKLLLSGESIDTGEAFDIGFVDDIVDHPSEFINFGTILAKKDGEALKAAKAYIDRCAVADSVREVKSFEKEYLPDQIPVDNID